MNDKSVIVYVGTYKQKDYSNLHRISKGIVSYKFDLSTGQLTLLRVIDDIDNPSFLTIDPQGRVLYAVDENSKAENCLVRQYSIDGHSGELHFRNKQLTFGTAPCYVAVDEKNDFIAVANYGSGSVTLLPIGEDGFLLPASDSQKHRGSGYNPRRQEAPHAHCAVFDPTNKFVFAVDLGIDKIMCYRLDVQKKQLVPNSTPFLKLPDGSGPRHLKFHRNGRFAYVINELNSTVAALSYDAEEGAFSILQTVSTLPDDFQAHNQSAELAFSPTGRYLYASNRGHDSLAIYSVDENSGHLASLGHQATYGQSPRHFAFDPSGTFVLVANQDSHNISTFRIDEESGLLKFVGQKKEVPSPVCVLAEPVLNAGPGGGGVKHRLCNYFLSIL